MAERLPRLGRVGWWPNGINPGISIRPVVGIALWGGSVNPPGRLSGNSPLIPWLNALRDFAISCRPQSGLNYFTKRAPSGTIYEIQPGFAGLQLSRFRFKSMGTDHLVCRTWDGTNEGASDINIAKSPKLRFSITSETIDVLTITYSSYNTGSQTRVATGT